MKITFKKYKVSIKDIDMGDKVYDNVHWFKEGITNDRIKEIIKKKYFDDYGNTYKWIITKTNETKEKEVKEKETNEMTVNDLIDQINEVLGKRVIHLSKEEKIKELRQYLNGTQSNDIGNAIEDFTLGDLMDLEMAIKRIIVLTKKN